MKPQLAAIAVLAWVGVVRLPAQITWDVGNSTWGSGNGFVANYGVVATNSSYNTTTAYGGGMVDGTRYVFGFAHETVTSVSSYNLSGTDLGAGTTLHLQFTNLSAAPKYVAITGGALTSYTFDSGTGTLSLTASTINPVASASDATGNTLGSAFGLLIETGGSLDFGGTVFRTDMYWGDVSALAGYAGTTYAAGLNASGQNGSLASFYAYLPVSFLNSVGINSPADCQAALQKNSVDGVALDITRELYAPSDPGYSGSGYAYVAASTYDFNGAGIDNYILASYANSSWSNGDIGVTAVPEPATVALGLGLGVLALVAARRRRA